jgi:hypothetical protein
MALLVIALHGWKRDLNASQIVKQDIQSPEHLLVAVVVHPLCSSQQHAVQTLALVRTLHQSMGQQATV